MLFWREENILMERSFRNWVSSGGRNSLMIERRKTMVATRELTDFQSKSNIFFFFSFFSCLFFKGVWRGVGKLKRDLGWLKKEEGEGGICDGSGENGKVERMRGFNRGMRREMEFVQENREKKGKARKAHE